MKNLKFLLIIAVTTLFTSCESNTYEEVSGIIANPTYSKNVKPIIQSNCLNCHSAGGTYPDLSNYTNLKNECSTGSVLCRIDASCGNIMPQGGKMPQVTIDLLNKWAAQGYNN